MYFYSVHLLYIYMMLRFVGTSINTHDDDDDDDVCPVLSVTLVHCGQSVGWIKMKLGMQAGLGPGHIALDGSPASPPTKGHSPSIFGPYLLWPNGWMN